MQTMGGTSKIPWGSGLVCTGPLPTRGRCSEVRTDPGLRKSKRSVSPVLANLPLMLLAKLGPC